MWPNGFIYSKRITSTPKVCAKYTHGGNAKGRFEANFHSSYYEYYSSSPAFDKNITVEDSQVTRDEEGCGLIRLSRENLLELTEKTLTDFGLAVRFSEEGTASQGEATWSGSLTVEPFNLAVSGPDSSMVGLPYTAEISLTQHDGTPIPAELITVCVSLYGDIEQAKQALEYHYGFDEEELFEAGKSIIELRQSVVCENLTTSNPEGKIKFFVPLVRQNIPSGVKKMIIRATATNYPSNNETKMVQPTRSMRFHLQTS